jgi:hypothetical protein
MTRKPPAVRNYLAQAVTRGSNAVAERDVLRRENAELQIRLASAMCRVREQETELAELRAHYRMCEAELVLAKAAYAGVVAKLGADDPTDLREAA